MTRLKRITDSLSALSPSFLEVRDDSHKHAGHAGWREGGETHYHVTIASPKFNGLRKVQIHQQIYALLDAEFRSGLHALGITVKE